jgi:outer membrane protein TolC
LIVAARSRKRMTKCGRSTIPASRYWNIRLEPADRVPTIGGKPNVDADVRRALAERTDLAQARSEIQISDTNVELSKSDVLPDLRVQANYFGDGSGGSRILRTPGFPGEVIGTTDTSFGSVLGQVFSSDFPRRRLSSAIIR